MPEKEKKDRPIFKGRSYKSSLNQCRLKLVTLDKNLAFFNQFYLHFSLSTPNINPNNNSKTI